jgi:hypothetical protein
MIRSLKYLVLVLLVMAPGAMTMADDVSGADVILCTAVDVNICYASGGCENAPPWDLNIPDFIEIDVKEKVLRTTVASGQNRSTPIKNIERTDGLLVIQGFEAGRAFSFLIHESTGRLSTAVAREDINVAVFGVCTPVPSR